jgi:hypothetical protein
MTPADYFANLCLTVADRIELRLDEGTPLDAVRAIVAGLPKGWRLEFYDGDYPSGSDPGGYVTVDRQSHRYRVRRSNHGWTSQWEELTPEAVAEYAHRCRTHKDPYRPYDNLVLLERTRPTVRRTAIKQADSGPRS